MEIITGLILLILVYELIRFIVVGTFTIIKENVCERSFDSWYDEDGK